MLSGSLVCLMASRFLLLSVYASKRQLATPEIAVQMRLMVAVVVLPMAITLNLHVL